MDDLRATLGGFDPDAPLPGAPEPWDFLPMPPVRSGPPWAMAEMIAAEPALATRVARRVVADGSAARLADLIHAAALAGGPVVTTGCGTSEHAALAAAALLRHGRHAARLAGWGPVAAQALELSLEPSAEGLVIGCSHEGGTAATLAALDAASRAGARTAAITASAGSPVARGRDAVLATVEMDRSWCHTVGYLSPMIAAAVTADLVAGTVPQPGALGARVAGGIEAAHAPIAGHRPDEAIGEAIAGANRLLVIASGVDRITARELVLKVEEASWLPAAARDLETFLHGHLPATGPDTALILVLLERDRLEERAKRARQALRAAGAVGIRSAAILGAGASAAVPAELTPAGRVVVPESDLLPGVAASLLGAVGPLQLLTLAIAAARGTNPDPIRRDDPAYLRAAELADDPAG
jgi:glucosamine--fructose-6-phosphate aminotransferase (isomerizing)